VQVWRLVRRPYLADAFTGEGARREGGRWNSMGVPVVYASATLALALLEHLVHAGGIRLPTDTVAIPVDIPARISVERIEAARLPRHWRQDFPMPRELQAVGDAWVKRKTSAAMEVPSAIVPSECNYLLNPAHADFKLVKIGKAQPFGIDPRLLS
jgi:RES domain-containing protein